MKEREKPEKGETEPGIEENIQVERKDISEKPDTTPAPSPQDEIDAILAGAAIPEEMTPAGEEPEPAPTVMEEEIETVLNEKKEIAHEEAAEEKTQEKAPSPQDEIDAILAGAAIPEEMTPAGEEPEPAPAVMEEEIETVLNEENKVAPEEAAEEKTQEKAPSPQDEIDAIFASMEKEPQAGVAGKQKHTASEKKTNAQEEIDSIFADMASQGATEPARAEEASDETISEEDIDLLFGPDDEADETIAAEHADLEEKTAGAPRSVQDEIDSKLNAARNKGQTIITTDDAIDSILSDAEEEDRTISNAQDEVDALFAESSGGAKARLGETETPGAPRSVQDEIDSKLNAARNKGQTVITTDDAIDSILSDAEEEDRTISNAQDDIDSLFAEASAGEEKAVQPEVASQDDIDSLFAEVSTGEEEAAQPEVASQDDTDSLFAETSTREEEAAQPEIASQDDIDSLFAEASASKEPEPHDDMDNLLNEVAAGAEEDTTDKDLISQEDIDALLGETEGTQPAAVSAGAPAEENIISQDDIDSLFSEDESATTAEGGEDEDLDALFESEAETSIPGEKSEAALESAFMDSDGIDTSMLEEAKLGDLMASEEEEGETVGTAEAPKKKPEKAEAGEEVKKGLLASIAGKFLGKKKPETEQMQEEETTGEETEAVKPGKKALKVVVPLAAVLLLAVGGGIYYWTKMRPEPIEIASIEDMPGTQVTEEKEEPASPVEDTTVSPLDEEMPMEAENAPMEKEPERSPIETAPATEVAKTPEPQPPTEVAKTPEPQPPVETTADATGENLEMKLGIIIPVDYNSALVRVLTADVMIRFADSSEYVTAETKKFMYEIAVEEEIDQFFKDKFYEETHYVQDKLVAELTTKFKRRNDMEKIEEINIENFKLR